MKIAAAAAAATAVSPPISRHVLRLWLRFRPGRAAQISRQAPASISRRAAWPGKPRRTASPSGSTSSRSSGQARSASP